MKGLSILLTLALLVLANCLPKWLERNGNLPAHQPTSERARLTQPVEKAPTNSARYHYYTIRT